MQYWINRKNIYFMSENPVREIIPERNLMVSVDGVSLENVIIPGFTGIEYSFGASYDLLKSVLELPESDRQLIAPMAAVLLTEMILDNGWRNYKSKYLDDITNIALMLEKELKADTRIKIYYYLWSNNKEYSNLNIQKIYEKLVDLDESYAWENIESLVTLKVMMEKYRKNENEAEKEIRVYINDLLEKENYQENVTALCVNMFKTTCLYIPYGRYLEMFYDKLPNNIAGDQELNHLLDTLGDNDLIKIRKAIDNCLFNEPSISAIIRYSKTVDINNEKLLDIICHMIHYKYYECKQIIDIIKNVYFRHPARLLILEHLLNKNQISKQEIPAEIKDLHSKFRARLSERFKNSAESNHI
jgi:uncharacterized protein (DUF2132 family)